MPRMTKASPWVVRLPTDYTDGADVWGGWYAERPMTYDEAVAEARAEMVAALGPDYEPLAPFVIVTLR